MIHLCMHQTEKRLEQVHDLECMLEGVNQNPNTHTSPSIQNRVASAAIQKNIKEEGTEPKQMCWLIEQV